MQTEIKGLAASYRRRTLYLTLGAALIGACLIGSPNGANAQGAPPPAVPADASKQASGTEKQSDPSAKQPDGKPKDTDASSKKGSKRKPAQSSLKVVPVPRQNNTRAADKQGAAGATPGAQQPGGGAPGTNPQGGAPAGGRFGQPGQGGFGGFGGFGGGQGRRNRGGAGGDLSGFFGPGGVGRGTTFQFEFHGADITNVLRLFSTMSGLTITTDPGLAGPVTIINNGKSVTLDDAFRILQSVLKVRGYTALQNGSVLEILPLNIAAKETPLFRADTDSGPLDPRDQVMTQIIPLENVDATQMAKDLLPLVGAQASIIGSAGTNSLIVTDNSSNVQRIISLINALDKQSSRTELKVYPLRHAEASNVAQTITDLYSKLTPRSAGAGAPGAQPGQPNFQIPGQQPGAQAGGPNARPAVIAVADNRTNSVLVVASPDNQEQIARDIISRLDDDESALDTEVIPIKYSNAQDVANIVNSVLSNMHGQPNQSSSGGGRFGGFNPFGFGGFGGNQNNGQTVTSNDPFGQVAADPRTNSLFVTANPERMARIKQLIKQVDVEVPIETTTFVIKLKNAKAEDVAFALSQAFGTTNSNSSQNPFAGLFGGGNNNQQRAGSNRTSSRNGASTSRGGGGSSLPGLSGRSVPPPPNAPDGGSEFDPYAQNDGGSAQPQGIPGVMTDQGFVPDTSKLKADQEAGKTGEQTRQIFGGFGGGRRQGVGQSTQPQYGRGSNGSYSNLLQLQNNVFVTPSPDGDSLIITTTPDNYKALQGIIDQLDVIPRQVMVEVIVAEVTLDSDQKFGFNINAMLHKLFGANNVASGQISQPATGFGPSASALDAAQTGAQFLISGTNYSLLLQALNTDNKVKVMSTPRIFTSNAQQAVIDINTYVPYITGQTSNGAINGGTAFVSSNVQYLPIGVTITVTPRITRDGRVSMDLTQDLSDLIQFDQLNTGQGTISAPRYNNRHEDTSITIKDGQTAVVGGLIRDSQTLTTSKVPLLGDVPLLGQFFRSREKINNKVELLFFVTPHIVDTDEKTAVITKDLSAPVVRQLPQIQQIHPELTPPPLDKKGKKKPLVPKDNTTPDASPTTTPDKDKPAGDSPGVVPPG